ncbi:MAG: M28 family peptidase [Proteobacteria bacterium]|nr:M28 family peptidase [Pseudomonadota bacterium]
MHPVVFRLLLTTLTASISVACAVHADEPTSPRPETNALLGFRSTAAANEIALEKRFDAALSATEMREWLQRLAAAPNHVGAPHNKANAEFLLSLFKQWGWDAHIETFDALYPTPQQIALELIAPTTFKAALHEPPVAGDSTSNLPGALPPYNVYGADGDVTAELVYVNYGMPDDYKELDRHGVSVKGKIAITRYGGGWRGLKPKLAYEHGAVGCLIYSDPHDDGYAAGDTYPQGGWRPPEGVQRGSVADMQVYPGDPTTPGYGSTPGAKHLALKDAKTILKIPVLPISYADVTPLLKALGGPVAPASWRGALPLTYHLGGGPAKAHLLVKSDWSRKPLYDVIATLKGSQEPDRWIVRGNHHDGWVMGAWDPLSGTVAMLGEAKAIGQLAKSGWKPKRTLVYTSWDGEEAGLLGSTEWVETHAAELRDKAVVYVNSDTNARGFLGAEGSHSLQHLVNRAAADVIDPETQVSVLERARAHMRVAGASPQAKAASKENAKIAAEGGDLPIGALGSGSDYSAFLEHLGIASLNLGFGGEDDDAGVYHSLYDSFDHFDHFGDPGFKYEVVLAQVAGRVMLRMANADLLPLRFGDFSATLDRYVAQLHALADEERKSADAQHALLDARAYALVSDPTRPVAPPERLSDVPSIDFAPLDLAAKNLSASTKAFQIAYAARIDGEMAPTAKQAAQINTLIARMEQSLTSSAGLPGRDWFKHMIYAPGMLTGYGVKTVPGVREALEARDWPQANAFAVSTANVLDGYRAQIDALTALLQKPPR